MSATSKTFQTGSPPQSAGVQRGLGGGLLRLRLNVRLLTLGLMLLGSMPSTAADTAIPAHPPTASGDRSNRIHAAYVEGRGQFAAQPTNQIAAWQFARACFERADFSTNDAQRAALAGQGIAASQRAIQIQSNSAAAWFYLGVNLGQLARTKLFTALGLLDEMESAWERSIAIDPQFHFAAAERSLGLLYLDAPGWPVSLGSRSKARRHLQNAVTLSPGYPENHLCWLETRWRWGEHKAVQAQLATVESALASARTNFASALWSHDWEDWNARWNNIKIRAGTPSTTRSPRDSR